MNTFNIDNIHIDTLNLGSEKELSELKDETPEKKTNILSIEAVYSMKNPSKMAFQSSFEKIKKVDFEILEFDESYNTKPESPSDIIFLVEGKGDKFILLTTNSMNRSVLEGLLFSEELSPFIESKEYIKVDIDDLNKKDASNIRGSDVKWIFYNKQYSLDGINIRVNFRSERASQWGIYSISHLEDSTRAMYEVENPVMALTTTKNGKYKFYINDKNFGPVGGGTSDKCEYVGGDDCD